MNADQGGQLGLEALAFGLLVFVAGTLVFVNGWAIVDAKLAAASAVREAGRAYVEGADATSALAAARVAADDTLVGYGRSPTASTVTIVQGGFARCERVVLEVRTQAPLARIPWLGQVGTLTVAARHSELVDPYRAGLAGSSSCA